MLEEKWFNKDDSREFIAYGEYGESPPSDISFVGLLNLNPDNLKPFTKELLDPCQQSEWLRASLSDLSRGINALFQFQDILEITLDVEDTDLVNRHYSYYESIVYLRESVNSWLDRNVLAGLTLLRPFLELSVYHIYWYIRGKHSNYKVYYGWLKHGKGKPNFQNTLNYIFDNLPTRECVNEARLKELKESVQNDYKTFCAYNHTPQINESITVKGGSLGNLALESFYYYLVLINILLREITFLYILTYPMSLFPVDKHIKFAFGGPIGLFFDKMNYGILEAYIGSKNTSNLKQSLKLADEVESLKNWFDNLPSLTSEEIEEDWDHIKQKIPNLDKDTGGIQDDIKRLYMRLALMKSHNRALGWALNYVNGETRDDEISEEIIEELKKRIRTL